MSSPLTPPAFPTAPLLSLAMIVRDEQASLARVLMAAREFCDEMIVVDTGSRDATVGIALAAGATVRSFPWVNDFAAARNFSFAQCRGEWILWLDADDILTPETISIGKQIREKLLPGMLQDYIYAPYNYGRNEQGEITLKQMRERFCRRAANPVWTGKVHECIVDAGKNFIVCPEFVVDHDPDISNIARKQGRNIGILDAFIDLDTAGTRELYQYAGELRGQGRFEEALVYFRAYLAKWPADMRDMFEEPYMVRLEVAECLRKVGRMDESIAAALECVRYNPTRAEGYGHAAVTYQELGNIAAAFPLFLAAAGCQLPKHGGIVHSTFYRKDLLKDALDYCKGYLAQEEAAFAASMQRVS